MTHRSPFSHAERSVFFNNAQNHLTARPGVNDHHQNLDRIWSKVRFFFFFKSQVLARLVYPRFTRAKTVALTVYTMDPANSCPIALYRWIFRPPRKTVFVTNAPTKGNNKKKKEKRKRKRKKKKEKEVRNWFQCAKKNVHVYIIIQYNFTLLDISLAQLSPSLFKTFTAGSFV